MQLADLLRKWNPTLCQTQSIATQLRQWDQRRLQLHPTACGVGTHLHTLLPLHSVSGGGESHSPDSSPSLQTCTESINAQLLTALQLQQHLNPTKVLQLSLLSRQSELRTVVRSVVSNTLTRRQLARPPLYAPADTTSSVLLTVLTADDPTSLSHIPTRVAGVPHPPHCTFSDLYALLYTITDVKISQDLSSITVLWSIPCCWSHPALATASAAPTPNSTHTSESDLLRNCAREYYYGNVRSSFNPVDTASAASQFLFLHPTAPVCTTTSPDPAYARCLHFILHHTQNYLTNQIPSIVWQLMSTLTHVRMVLVISVPTSHTACARVVYSATHTHTCSYSYTFYYSISPHSHTA
uniref:Protein rcaC n=1 Tax=Lygus hesperus TaxID=30085 RepID=A0A0A9Y6V5_LYGHE